MQRQTSIVCKHLNDSLLTIFKNTSQTIKQSSSKTIYQSHNKLMNKILLVSEKQIQQTIREILGHFLLVSQLKGMTPTVITLLTKFIQFFKFYQKHIQSIKIKKVQSENDSIAKDKKQQQKTPINSKKSVINGKQLTQSMKNHYNEDLITQILTQVIDIILLLQNKSKASDADAFLRIIQTAFSLIDIQFIQYMFYSQVTKLYSISFQCCLSNVTIQNISVSCLFSLTETLFSTDTKIDQKHLILENLLEYLFRNKKFGWLKDPELNGLVWDLVVTAIKHQKLQDLQKFVEKQSNVNLINLMYKIAAQKAFSSKVIQQKIVPTKQSSKKSTTDMSSPLNNSPASQFIRCYKAFIYLSIQFSLSFISHLPKEEVIPFRDNVRLFNVVHDLERNWKMYILIEGIFEIIAKYPQIAINKQKGYLFFEIISKVAEQLCLCNKKISCQWVNQKSFLNKFYYGDLNAVNDGDFVKIIRNSLISLRKKFQYMKNQQNALLIAQDLDKSMATTQNVSSERSQVSSKKLQGVTSVKKRWEKFIKCIIKIIRYLSSISTLSQSDEQPVRKIILQLQHWFLICPSYKIKNLILQQLLVTTSTLKSKQQAIKISQCIQIGSNLIYGYYDMLDSIGLTIVMKMMAGIKAAKQEGKQFEELQEVFNMSQKLYMEQKIVKTQKQFSTTVQAFVQCANSLLADLEQPPLPGKVPALGKNPSQRYYKMIEYLLQKLNIVIFQNSEYLFTQWNFLTGFWMSFCSSKNPQIKTKTLYFVGEIIQKLLQMFKDRQQEIISIYLQLTLKCTTKKDLKIEYQIIAQIKNYIPLLQNQKALMETFKIVKVLQNQVHDKKLVQSTQTEEKKFIIQLSQLQQAFIKQGIFRIKKLDNLDSVIEGIEVLGNQKNEQYKILTLLWTVADHLRNLSSIYENQSAQNKNQYENLWKKVFQKIQTISQVSLNAQTKQSSIHTFTQIIAENSPVIRDNLLIELYQKIFIENLFINLMQNYTRLKQLRHSADISFKVDMIKAAGKNYLKLTKKFILQKIFKEPSINVQFALIKVVNYLSLLNDAQPKQNLPVELMYQFLVFAEKLIINENIENKYIGCETLGKFFIQLQKIGERSEQTTILWKKKYLPHLNEVKQNFKKTFSQKKQLHAQETQQNSQIKA